MAITKFDQVSSKSEVKNRYYAEINIKIPVRNLEFKGSASHFIFEINVGKRRIRHRTTLNLNDVIFDH